MRIGLLGPVGDHIDTLETVATFCALTLAVDALYYLGDDNPLVLLPKDAPHPNSEADFWQRTANLAQAEPLALERFVYDERERRATAGIQLFGADLVRRITSTHGHAWVLCHSSKHLTAEDQEHGAVLAYGNSPEHLIQRAGEQILVAPGPFESAGVMLLDDDRDGLHLELFNRKCESLLKRRLDFTPTLHPPAA